PPPAGLERRGRERLTLELAGVCIGLIDEPQSRDVESVTRLAVILDQVPAMLWTTDAELRVISRAGAGLKSQQILPERIVGASLLDQQAQHQVSSESVAAHRRALAGESVAYRPDSSPGATMCPWSRWGTLRARALARCAAWS